MCAQSTSQPEPYRLSSVAAAHHPEQPRGSDPADHAPEIAEASGRPARPDARIDDQEAEANQLRTEVARLQHALARTEGRIGELKRDKALLLKDVLIKDAYIAELRRMQRPPAVKDPDESPEAGDPHSNQTAEALHLQVAVLQRALAESRAEIEGYQRTLDLLRYRIVDWLNAVARRAGPVHRGAKSLLARWFGHRRA